MNAPQKQFPLTGVSLKNQFPISSSWVAQVITGALVFMAAVMLGVCSGCRTAPGPLEAAKLDRSMVIFYVESQNAQLPLQSVYYRDQKHPARNRFMNLCNFGKGFACWLDDVKGGSFVVSGLDCRPTTE
jgi:hypothetical protein